MKQISNWVLVLTGLLAIVYVNVYAWHSQQIKTRGEVLFLRLAPVDPLSLVQGQYMRLRFEIEKTYNSTQADQQLIQNSNGHVLAVIRLDSKRIGSMTGRLTPRHRPQQHSVDTLLIQVQAQLISSRDDSDRQQLHAIQIDQNSFLFQENTEDRYTTAKYGMFRVHANGRYVLIDLADENLRALTPQP